MIGHSGIGIRLQNVISGLAAYDQNDYYLFGDPEKLKQYQAGKNFHIINYSVPVYNPAEFLGHPEMARMDLLDIPHFNVPLRYIFKCIVTIHDIIPYVYRKYHSSFFKRIYFSLVMMFIHRFAKKIITVSDFTRNDLVKRLNFNKNEMITIHNAVSSRFYEKVTPQVLAAFRKKMNLPAEYMLTVGIGKEHKNLVFLIECLGFLWDSGKFKMKLVIAGSGGEVPDYAGKIIGKYNKWIIILPRMSSDDFPLVYHGASVFLYPSLYEGFGFPVLEAQSSGCPVISSNSSVLPEILQDSVLYFNPENKREFMEAVSRFFNEKGLAANLVKKGLANARRFNWDVSVRKLIDIYHAYSSH